jgi:hypothetical protein
MRSAPRAVCACIVSRPTTEYVVLRTQFGEQPQCPAFRSFVRFAVMSDFRVVLCGGGIAGTEGLLRLRRLAGDAVDVDVIAPNEELVYRPLAVREPFAFGPARRYPLRRIARDIDAEWIQDTLGWVDPDGRF